MGFKANYRFFLSHVLLKFHACNIFLAAENSYSFQVRSKNVIHETYIKTNPERLKKIYMDVMGNLMINIDGVPEVFNQEFTINVNVFCRVRS